jgi:Antitoxin VbhA
MGPHLRRHGTNCVATPGTLCARDFLVAQPPEKDHGDERGSYRRAVLVASPAYTCRMRGATGDGEQSDVSELLLHSDLSAEDRRRVYDAIVNSTTESSTPDRESVLLLIDFAAGRIDIDEYRERVLASGKWRRWGDVADIFSGPADPDWDADRTAVSHEIGEL